MNGAVAVTAPAKVNLSLRVGARRADGFHPLATVYHAIGLYDEVTVSDADDVVVEVRGDHRLALEEVPADGTNIAARAAVLLARHHGLDRGVRIVIDKQIPVAGGLAGGSADAAAALLACDLLWGLRTPREELSALASRLGSDVPFALVGGTAVGSGRGEVVLPMMTRGEYWWVVLESRRGLSTPAVYHEFDVLNEGVALAEPEIPDRLVTALRGHDVPAVGAALANDLQPAALRLRPELEAALGHGIVAGAHGALLSGSGPSCLFLCDSATQAGEVADALTGLGLGSASVVPGPVHGARVVAREGG